MKELDVEFVLPTSEQAVPFDPKQDKGCGKAECSEIIALRVEAVLGPAIDRFDSISSQPNVALGIDHQVVNNGEYVWVGAILRREPPGIRPLPVDSDVSARNRPGVFIDPDDHLQATIMGDRVVRKRLSVGKEDPIGCCGILWTRRERHLPRAPDVPPATDVDISHGNA